MFPTDFGNFTSDEIDSVFKNLSKRSNSVIIPGISQQHIKYTCDFVKYCKQYGHTLQEAYLKIKVI